MFTKTVKATELRLGDVVFLEHTFSNGEKMVTFCKVWGLRQEQDTVEVQTEYNAELTLSVGSGRTVQVVEERHR